MARIRTIKPEFFTSEDVVLLSPLARLLFIGLWCEADREGRFLWRPASLKLRYLPGDDVDIGALCDELLERGVVVRYGEQGEFAFIPSFSRHQVVNHREAKSLLPQPLDACPTRRDASATHDDASATREHASTTREARVATRPGGKGRERKGKELKLVSNPNSGGTGGGGAPPAEPWSFDGVSVPEGLRSTDFLHELEAWYRYRAKRGLSRWLPDTLAAQLRKWTTLGADRAAAALRWSREQQYQGVFESPEGRSRRGDRDQQQRLRDANIYDPRAAKWGDDPTPEETLASHRHLALNAGHAWAAGDDDVLGRLVVAIEAAVTPAEILEQWRKITGTEDYLS